MRRSSTERCLNDLDASHASEYATDSQYTVIEREVGVATVLALSREAPETRQWSLIEAAPAQEPWARSAYQPSGGARPVAALFSITVVAALLAAFAAIHVHHDAVRPKRLVVLSLRSLQPPPPARPKPQPQQAKVTPPPVFAPPPIVTPPVTLPAIVTSDIKAPTPPVPTVTVAPPAPVAAPQPVVATGPVNKGDLSSKMIDAVPPAYPVESRRLHEQGIVKLMVTLDTDGRVANVEVASTSGSYRLDRAALGAVRRWRWAPSVENGTPVMVQGYVTIPFVLKA
jgi:protein TonB